MGGALLVLRPRFRHVDLATLRAQGADARFGDMMMMQRRAAAAGSAAKHSAVAGPLGEVVRGGAARRPGLLRHGSHTQPRHHQGARGTRAAVATSAAPAKRDSELTVRDVMIPGRTIFTCKPDDSVEMALELLVHHRVSGLPVVDSNNVVVGVVSDFDLLSLDLAGKSNDSPIFPPTDETWQAFKMIKSAMAKGSGKRVRDVMTRTPLTVTVTTGLNDATSLLLKKRIRRLPVVDEAGRLVGIISRSNIIRIALEQRKAALDQPATAAATA